MIDTPKFQSLANPQLHVSPNPHELGAMSVAIVFPAVRVRFDVPQDEGMAVFNAMAKSALEVMNLWNKEEGKIVPIKDVNSCG